MKQLPLPEPHTWGGKRKRAGRKLGPRPNVRHRVRPAHSEHRPAHVTLRARRSTLRSLHVYLALEQALADCSSPRFRVIHFSVQSDHLHLIVEARDREALIRGVQGMAIRLARAGNHAVRRSGAWWADRYHARDLGSPREVRNAIAYVLLNRRKHAAWARGIDRCSSGRWFDGWREPIEVAERAITWAPRTWLASKGWIRAGRIAIDERPGAAARGAPA